MCQGSLGSLDLLLNFSCRDPWESPFSEFKIEMEVGLMHVNIACIASEYTRPIPRVIFTPFENDGHNINIV